MSAAPTGSVLYPAPRCSPLLSPCRQKAKLVHLLWEYLPKHTDQLTAIPNIDSSVLEDRNRKSVAQFCCTDVLGRGQFANVFAAAIDTSRKSSINIEVPADAALAIKSIKKEKVVNLLDVQRVNNEIQILQEIRHEGVVRLFGVFHTRRRLYMVMERGGGDLFDYLKQHPDGVPEVDAKKLILQIASAVSHCHRHGICHRDLKPENILVGEGGRVKLVDFGLCFRAEPGSTLNDFCGSPGFFAPEMIVVGSYNGFAVDVWSLGCILYELATLRSPWRRMALRTPASTAQRSSGGGLVSQECHQQRCPSATRSTRQWSHFAND